MARLAGVRAIVSDWLGKIMFLETALIEDHTAGTPLENVRAGIGDLIAQGVFEDVAELVVGWPFRYDSPEMRESYIGAI